VLSLEHHKKVSVSTEQLSLALTNSAQDNHYLLFILKHLSKYRIWVRVIGASYHPLLNLTETITAQPYLFYFRIHTHTATFLN